MANNIIQPPYYPIIYVRGYAATMNEIEKTVATPYMGFNLGSTKIRQNHKGDIVRFIFESPLIRLMKDEGYLDTYHEGDFVPHGERFPAKSIWIFRYYEKVSKQLGKGERYTIPQFAADLRKFILRIREHVCRNNFEAKKAFRVYLVAHSMGGLICRCYLQNICYKGTGNQKIDKNLELPGKSLVEKVFTYATPHNGIDFKGINIPDLGVLDRLHFSNFNRDAMRKYLDLPKKFHRVDSLNGRFPVDHFFCFVGTNYQDYAAFSSLSRRGTGPMSDGLVMIRNATVDGSPRAFAYRSHSGHYGIVNSEEGYQNLRRFLFGQIRVDAQLIAEEITLPNPIQKLKDKGKEIRASYNIDVAAKVRGANYFLNERKVSHKSAIRRKYDDIKKKGKKIYLFSGYLLKKAKTKESKDKALAFAVQIGIEVPVYEVDNRLWFDDHFEGGYLFNEIITFHVLNTNGKTTVKYGLASEVGPGEVNRIPEQKYLKKNLVQIEVPLGFPKGTKNPPRPGFCGKLILTAMPWNN